MREPVQQLDPAGHGHGVVAHAQGPAGRVVGGDEQQSAVLPQQRTTGPARPGGGDAARLSGSDLGEVDHGAHPSRDRDSVARTARDLSTSATSGIAVEHSSLLGDQGARDVGELQDAAQVPAGQQPVHQRAAEGVTGTEPVDDVDREGRYLDALARRSRQARPWVPA